MVTLSDVWLTKSAFPQPEQGSALLYSYLNTAYLHNKDVCAENGLIPQAVPQMLDVRIRVTKYELEILYLKACRFP